MIRIATFAVAASLALPVFADGHASGDAAAGEKVFRKCKSCHMVQSAEGEILAKGGKSGPNLWGLLGRPAGTVEGFRYGKDLVAAGEAMPEGWNEAVFVEYVADPKKWLQTTLDNSKAKSKMSFKLKKADEAANVWAYLVSLGPAPAPVEEAEAEASN